ncbi:MAG: 3-methyl-2-oxobutanoate hydroxymethyltransferase [Gemmatimonadota bacterium]
MEEPPRRVTIHDLAAMKRAGRKIAMITAYDAPFAALVDRAGVDAILVGDSVGKVLAGEETTLPVTLEQMIYHGRMVCRGVTRALVVVDLPFLSYQVSPEEALRNAGRVLQQTGASAVKLEGGAEVVPAIESMVGAGIPVMGHLGFTPQSVHALAGAEAQGTREAAVRRLVEDARALEAAGAFGAVVALVPAAVGERLSASVSLPIIGFGAGDRCDGQVMVLHDMLGLNDGSPVYFLEKPYADLGSAVREAVQEYVQEVRGTGAAGARVGAGPASGEDPPRLH